MVLATSTDGQKFGDITQGLGWIGREQGRTVNFLFAWRRDGGFDKLPKVGGVRAWASSTSLETGSLISAPRA